MTGHWWYRQQGAEEVTISSATSSTTSVTVTTLIVGALAVYLIRNRIARTRRRRTRSPGLPGGLGGLRVSREDLRRLLPSCTSANRLADYLLDRAARKLPEDTRARFAEEWHDHRQHYTGWRLVWWALCVRATATRTVSALGPSRLPHDS